MKVAATRPLREHSRHSVALTRMGLGATRLGNLYRKVSDEDAFACIKTAFDSGIRYFDTAPQYGLGISERRLGAALKAIGSKDVVISTKVGRLLIDCPPDQVTPENFIDVPQKRILFDYSYDGVMRSYEASLRRLSVDRINILLVHDICAFSQGSEEASDSRRRELFDLGGFRALSELRADGTIDAFGAGVNQWQVCEKLLKEGDFDCFMLAGRYTLLEQEAIETFLPLCQRRNVGVMLASPLNSGILATGPILNARYNYARAPQYILDRVRRLKDICDRFEIPLMAAALQFGLAHPAIKTVVVGPANDREAAELVELMDFDIPTGLWEELKASALLHPKAPTPD